MNQFDESIYSMINSVTKDGSLVNDALLTEALLSTQRAINQLETIKSAVVKKEISDKAGKLLLLCAELEKVNLLLLQIKQEYSL
mgnify:CR=1 FL=1